MPYLSAPKIYFYFSPFAPVTFGFDYDTMEFIS